MKDTRPNLKITPEARRFLRLIAAMTGEKQSTVLHRLLTAEWERVQKKGS